jgi:elongation factor G
VVYRETITQESEAEGIFNKQTAASSRQAKARVRVIPLTRGTAPRVTNLLNPTLEPPLPKNMVEAALSTLKDALSSGPILGYPMLDLEVSLLSLELVENQTDEPTVRIAASQALKNALAGASPSLMEPIMFLEVTCPEESVGEIMGDLSSRLGRVEDMNSLQGGFRVINAKAPLSELFGYSTAIRSQTQGRGTFLMRFDHFDIVERKTQKGPF